jgi:hypothetical protein
MLLGKTVMDSKQAYLQCLEKLIWALDRLEAKVEPSELARIAELIVQPMMGPWRFFHTPEHIFDVGGNEDAIEVLAALFHDTVYVQVDRSINFNVSYYITPVAKEVNKQLQIRDKSELSADATFEMVMLVFNFEPGEVLNPFSGQNEFLSALVAAKALEPFLKREQLLQIAGCIEATIPFRAAESGVTVSQRLYDRLQAINSLFNLSLTDEQMRHGDGNSYALINFHPNEGDKIDLLGSATNYQFSRKTLPTDWSGTLFTAISTQNDDVIAYLLDPAITLTASSPVFI